MMEKEDNTELIKKSKSAYDIPDAVLSNAAAYTKGKGNFCGNRRLSRTFSESSLNMAVDSDSEEAHFTDSGVADQSTSDGQALLVLEQKIDRLNDLFQEQCRLLTTLKEDIRHSKAAMEKVEQHETDVLAEFVKKAVFQSTVKEYDDTDSVFETNSRARSLLNAIEVRQGNAADRGFKDALADFLQSDDLKEHMVAATAESVRDVVGECISRELSSLYLPMLELSHRRLVRQLARTVEDAFTELEENSACLSRSVYKISRSLRRAMERHQHLLEATAHPRHNMAAFKCTVEELLHNEVKQWRQKVLSVFTSAPSELDDIPEQIPPENVPLSPLQPPDSHSVIDQLMMVAKITSEIETGDINAAFELALNAADLTLVTAACRRGAAAFTPRCRLRQDVLLALLQQLSTDMLHDTQLKCRFLEDSIMSLDASDPVTRAHLPLIVGEVRKHLTNFVASYPGHAASKRIALIVMAVENLLK